MRRAALACLAVLLAGCGPTAAPPTTTAIEDLSPRARPAAGPLRAVASTSILADVVSRVAGEHVQVESLVPMGVDPHAFQPSPREVRRLADADVVFVAGLGLEAFLDDVIREAALQGPVVSVSAGIEPILLDDVPVGSEADPAAVDPHTWTDPRSVMVWTDNLQAALQALDPDNAEDFARNADRYRTDLKDLDAWIREEVGRIPASERLLVTDHQDLGYFARAYGFDVVGTIVPGASTLAEPSASQLARLLESVGERHVPAVFVTTVINPALAETFAADAGIRLVPLYVHSLSAPDGPVPSYLNLMRYNVRAVVEALAP